MEVEATVAAYFEMLRAELSGMPYNKAESRRRLQAQLSDRAEASIEFKHANISAVLIDLGFPFVPGYKPRFNYQGLLYEVTADRLARDRSLQALAASDADRAVAVPSVEDLLAALTDPPRPPLSSPTSQRERGPHRMPLKINYLEREARNHALGAAGEEFVLRFERARLLAAGRDSLADRIEHISTTRGDGEGFDIRSFETSGQDRLIEVKTTKYGRETPFYVSRNEVHMSEVLAPRYHLYRLFQFRDAPRLFTLAGALSETCALRAESYVARVGLQ